MRGSKNFRDLLEGGLKNHKFLLRGVEKFLSCLIIRGSFSLRGVKKFHLSCEGGQKVFSGSVMGIKNVCNDIFNSTTPLLLCYK